MKCNFVEAKHLGYYTYEYGRCWLRLLSGTREPYIVEGAWWCPFRSLASIYYYYLTWDLVDFCGLYFCEIICMTLVLGIQIML